MPAAVDEISSFSSINTQDGISRAPRTTGAIAHIGTERGAYLRTPTRWMANALWVGFLLFSLGVFVATLPARFLNLRDEVRLVSASLEQLHVDPDLLPGYVMTLDTLVLGAYVLVGILIFWRKSSEWVSFFASLTLVIAGTAIVRPMDALYFADPRVRVPLLILFSMGAAAIYILLYTFPNGHFVPRWTAWLVLLSVAYVTGTYLVPVWAMHPLRWPPAPIAPIVLIPMGLGAALQIYRYRLCSSRQQKQQTKWIVYGLTIGAIGLLSFRVVIPAILPQVLRPGFEHLVYIVIGIPVAYASLMLFPITIGISILFYRLWDIDLLISRTLAYGSLTAVLAGVYTASITLFQRLFIALTGQQSDLAVVFSTLIIAAAFTPLKEHFQKVIDRRLRDVTDAERKLKVLAEQIESRISPVEPFQVTERMLAEVIKAFNAQGGAVFWEQDGVLKMIHSQGEWDGVARAKSNLSGAQSAPLGMVALGARRNGADYTEHDCQVLEQIASVVARAIEEDRDHVKLN